MKKLVLLVVSMLAIISANSQQACPTDIKRNNGNNCTQGGTGGQLQLEFASQPNPRLQILLLTSPRGTATIVPGSKEVTQRGGRWEAEWCFETDNLGPISRANTSIQFYIDSNGNGLRDDSEPIFICSASALPIKFKSIESRRLDKNTIQVVFEAEEDDTIKFYRIMLSNDGGKTYKEKTIVFPNGIQGGKTYTVNVKL